MFICIIAVTRVLKIRRNDVTEKHKIKYIFKYVIITTVLYTVSTPTMELYYFSSINNA